MLCHLNNDQPLLNTERPPASNGVDDLMPAALVMEHAPTREAVAHFLGDIQQGAGEVEEVRQLRAPHGCPGRVRKDEKEQKYEHLHEHVPQ
eukprot:2912309-Prymnesium_polylepis.1